VNLGWNLRVVERVLDGKCFTGFGLYELNSN